MTRPKKTKIVVDEPEDKPAVTSDVAPALARPCSKRSTAPIASTGEPTLAHGEEPKRNEPTTLQLAEKQLAAADKYLERAQSAYECRRARYDALLDDPDVSLSMRPLLRPGSACVTRRIASLRLLKRSSR